MSAPREGMHLAREAQDLTQKMRDGVITGTKQTGGVQGGAVAGQFQRKFEGYDRMDDEMNTKLQLMDKDGMTPFGQVYYDERVGKWLQRKAAVAETANLDAWFNAEYNKNDLASRQLAQEIYPEFYDARARDMLDRMQEIFNLKMIELRGPQSKEDLYKQWLLNTGRVVLPPDWDRIGADPTADQSAAERQASQTAQFRGGLVRMPMFSTVEQRRVNNKSNKANGVSMAAQQNRVGTANYFSWGTTDATKNTPLAQGKNTFSRKVMSGLQE